MATPDINQTIGQLKAQGDMIDCELEDIRKTIHTNESVTQTQFRSLEKTVNEIRDSARDVMHIAVGVDGRNGLRGTIEHLTKNVGVVLTDFEGLKQATTSYNETKTVLLKMFATSAVAVVFQLMAAVWYIATEHHKQETMREDLNKVITYIDKMRGSAGTENKKETYNENK